MYWNAGYQWHPGEKQNKAMHAKNQENKMVNVQTQITKFIPINLKKKGHAKTTMPHGAILWQIITKKLLLSTTERRRSNN